MIRISSHQKRQTDPADPVETLDELTLEAEERCERTGPIVTNQNDVSSTFGILGEELIVHSSQGGRKVERVEHNAVHGGREPPRLEWWNVAMIQLAEVVGMAILTMPVAFAQLGWVLSILLLAINGIGTVLVGHALRSAKVMYPAANSFTLMAKYTTGSSWFVGLVSTFTILVLFIAVSGYLLSIAQS